MVTAEVFAAASAAFDAAFETFGAPAFERFEPPPETPRFLTAPGSISAATAASLIVAANAAELSPNGFLRFLRAAGAAVLAAFVPSLVSVLRLDDLVTRAVPAPRFASVRP